MEIVELRQQLEQQSKNKKNKVKDEETIEKERDEEQERAFEIEAAERREEQMLEMQLARTALKERIDHLNRLILSSKSIGVNSSGSLSSLSQYARFSQVSLTGSVRSSMTTPSGGRDSFGGRESLGGRDSFGGRESLGGRESFLDRTMSVTSSSTIGRRSSGGQRLSGEVDGTVAEMEEDSMGEYGDGIASLTSQNQALQADLADKNRYISTLEKRLLQARRASSSRTSVGLSAPSKAIMVGEDHSVSAVLKEKDAEIADLRARLDDKDRMLAALRSAARSRDTADASGNEVRFSNPEPEKRGEGSTSQTPTKGHRRRTKSVDEMNKMLEEMIQDRVETGQIIRGVRGSVRLPAGQKLELLGVDAAQLEPLRQSPTPDAKPPPPAEATVGAAL
ncbi:hypothetical protein NQ176_g10985 [Zarea fungicola]|uniref:Uncharacterized protein n=1 Tax=Zarea fungicola TaxID=93591 RepID=A0ACC1MDN1_9HYPO|nr:hypothetical protein NQ176_g10985 [Lecanicillium fungicola]